MTQTLLVGRCFWCKSVPPDIRDLDNGNGWCAGCAKDTVFKGDPIEYYDELTPEAAEYTRTLHSRGFRRRDHPTTAADED